MRVAAAYPTLGRVERLDAAMDEIVPANAKIEVLAKGFDWSEGPVWIDEGDYVLFSDVPQNIVYKWKEGEGLTEYLQPSGLTDGSGRGGSNGLALNPEGQLVLCQHGDRRMAIMDAPLHAPKPKFTTIADSYNEKQFNSPNDCAYHKNGDLYFTDPPYGLGGQEGELGFSGVYRVNEKGEVQRITKELTRPNGIAFSPDYKTLYVANSDRQDPKWMAYDVAEDGSVSGGRLFFDADTLPKDRQGGCDGMKVDQEGNVYATGPGGVLIFNPEGKHLGTIMPYNRTANCCFGDDGKTLYITADRYLARIRLHSKGMGF
ncbi:SMP-30/gluconolactonase/LRE family protein [bacterium]|nr:SMP-30/gluconolactonase/LRE family protein [bacterium]